MEQGASDITKDRNPMTHPVTHGRLFDFPPPPLFVLPSPAPPEALGLRPDELAATDCMGWFRAIAAISEDTPRLRVCSMSDTSADYLLQDAIRQGALPLDRKMSMPSIDSLAYWISRNEPLGLVVCDVGISHAVQAHMAIGRCL